MKTLEQPKCRPLLSLTTASVATESVCAPSDKNIGWAVIHRVCSELPPANPCTVLSFVQAQYENGTLLSRLSLATTQDPSDAGGWTRHGTIFPQVGGVA